MSLMYSQLVCRNALQNSLAAVARHKYAAQDISGGQPVQLEGTDLPVWGMEIDPDKAKQQFRSYSATDKGSKVSTS